MMPYGERPERTAEDFDEIEAVESVRGGFAEVVQKGDRAAVVAAFLSVGQLAPRLGTSSELPQVTVASFDFYEDEDSAVEADQVEFSIRRAAVAQQDRVSHLGEKPRGIPFSGGAETFAPGTLPGGLPDRRRVVVVRHCAGGV